MTRLVAAVERLAWFAVGFGAACWWIWAWPSVSAAIEARRRWGAV